MIDAREQFAKRFIQHAQSNLSKKETDDRLKTMGRDFIKMIFTATRNMK